MPNDYNRSVIEEFRANGGQVGGGFAGATLLLLHSTGAKTGLERVHPLRYQQVGHSYAIFASRAGAPVNPDWYHNLLAHPRARAEIGADLVDVVARVAQPGERERIWTRQKEIAPAFAEYEKKTDRQIPVIILDPVH